MSAIVIDASATLAWLFGENDPNGWLAEQLPTHSLMAPFLWRLEVVNAIIVKKRRRHITRAQGDLFLQVLDRMQIAIPPPRLDQSLYQLADLSRPHQLTAYDAIYLDLAMTATAPLLTLDGNLRESARRVGVAVIES